MLSTLRKTLMAKPFFRLSVLSFAFRFYFKLSPSVNFHFSSLSIDFCFGFDVSNFDDFREERKVTMSFCIFILAKGGACLLSINLMMM